MSKRVMGKASFCNVQDLQGNIQSYVARDSIGQEFYQDFKKMDIGDIVGITGEVFKTKTGEISHPCFSGDTALQEPSGSSGEVPRPDQHRFALPSEICGPDHEPGSEGHFHQTFQDHQQYP